LLPSAAFFLGLNYQPARFMIDSGLPIALATDYNPGSSPSGSMPFVLSLACVKLKMTPAEAINAATINSAYAMQVNNIAGSIAIGKAANVFVTNKIPSLDYIPYSFTENCIEQVYIKGKPI
jgi:imidazolonepropionase